MLDRALKQYNQWMISKIIPRKDQPGKTDKIAHSAHTLKPASPVDPNSWSDFDTAYAALMTLGDGWRLAFALSERDPFFLIDVDNCFDANGLLSPQALALVDALPGVLVEVSNSGQGLHLIGSTTRRPDHSCRDSVTGLEFYTADRLLTMTGQFWQGGDAATVHDQAIDAIVAAHFPPKDYGAADWTDEPRPEWSGPTDDSELLKMARKSGSPFKAGASFADLYDANADKLAEAYPTNQLEKGWDYSTADMALAQHLAFWTGCDCERIKRIMLGSGLNRDKWEREGYLDDTIIRAVGRQTDVLGSYKTQRIETVSHDTPRPVQVSGKQYLGVAQQLEHFAGCVYVRSHHKIMTPTGELLKPDQFRATYGGYEFALDASHNKATKSAWEVFTESQAIRWPKVSHAEFMPLRPAGDIWTEYGLTYVNCYVPAPGPRKPGDITPFLRHLELLLPNERDRQILLAYMAACVQHQGHKFQWCPLIQGTEGNGKSLFSYCVKRAIGDRYSHTPNPHHIANNFNAWMWGKTFYMVEDIYVPEHKLLIWESLKPMITGGEGLQVELKGVDAKMMKVCGNFILNSNHKDAVRKTRGDRRVAPFFTAQQTPEEIEAAGMGGVYFPTLYSWLNNGGYEVVANFLWEYAIPVELNPAMGAGGKANRAPHTSSTDELLALSLGSIEQEVLEAIDEQRGGFAGGFVSSKALDRLLTQIGADRRVARNKRSQMMLDLGYILHPALRDGRLTQVSPFDDGARPRIYVRANSLQCNLSADQVAEAYFKTYNAAATDGAAAFKGV